VVAEQDKAQFGWRTLRGSHGIKEKGKKGRS